ncbi:MAG: ABC transporter ATP-binding protein [Candidatus Gracilibacteria bacterium]|nr:ABC transporter ATP-binding protein [Candidatus Gracilibacteria bacterium]
MSTLEIKTPAVLIENLDKYLDGKQVLFGINLSIGTGSVFGFLGPNGAGKTTTMKAILGLILPDAGTVSILGDSTLSNETKEKIGFMPENTYLYKYLTGREFLRFNGKFFQISDIDLEAKIEEILHKVGLDTVGDKLLGKYSKGMLQRIGLGQAIINNPSVVFLDEPMSGLDPIGRKMVKDLILELKKNGTTVFFNTHILSDVESICDSFAIIHQGHLVANDLVKNLDKPLEEYFIEKIHENTEGNLEVR